ncbi:MAG: 50S ribosomal protein L11 methyltransferase [Polyangiaceae bacterium]|jgi:ribosomal protein L11 methyltransferase|nr:50S ribosomal protein L11 methyltransferase [Polyangiaceae bacterium]
MSEPRYPFVHVTTDAENADALSGALFDLGATGVEERDETTYVKGPADGGVLLVASFEERAAADLAVSELADVEGVLAVSVQEVVGDAWRDAWKEFYEPFALTPSIVVRPPWREVTGPVPGATEGATVLVLEPGRAFGTGLHATTSLVANILDERRAELAGQPMLDAGCGSGILSFVGLALGAANATAFDIDAEVIDTVRENAERNSMSERLELFAGTIADVSGTFPWVVANIETQILDPMAEQLVAHVAQGGNLVLSGILTAEEQRMTARFTSLSRKLRVVATRHMTTGGERAYDKDGWVAIHLALD